MASVNIQKVKGGQCVGLMRHDYRVGKNHTNEHIDSSIKNSNLVHTTDDSEWSYDLARNRYKQRLLELDSKDGQNRRKDRVEVLAINVPSPDGASRKQQEIFFDKVYWYLHKRFGTANLLSSIVHYDEVHEYAKKGVEGQIERVESRPHLHFKTFAVDKGDKFNAKELTSRKNLLEIQKDIDGIAKGMGLVFHTNEKTKSKKTVESLKNESEALEELEKELLLREFDLTNVDNEIEYKKEQLKEIKNNIATNAAILEVMQPTQQDLAILKLGEEIDEEIKQLKHELGYQGYFDSNRGFRYISESSAIGLNSSSIEDKEYSTARGILKVYEKMKKKLEPIIYAIKVKLGIIEPPKPKPQKKMDLNSNTKKKRDIGLSR